MIVGAPARSDRELAVQHGAQTQRHLRRRHGRFHYGDLLAATLRSNREVALARRTRLRVGNSRLQDDIDVMRCWRWLLRDIRPTTPIEIISGVKAAS
jgi:hypothetical protein